MKIKGGSKDTWNYLHYCPFFRLEGKSHLNRSERQRQPYPCAQGGEQAVSLHMYNYNMTQPHTEQPSFLYKLPEAVKHRTNTNKQAEKSVSILV